MIIKILYIALGGSIGSILRFLFSNFCKVYFPLFPIGTLAVNVLGSFFIGVFVSYLNNKEVSEIIVRYFFIIGILGSFTTFSAFSIETINLIESGEILKAGLNILFSVTLCIAGCWLGMNLSRQIY